MKKYLPILLVFLIFGCISDSISFRSSDTVSYSPDGVKILSFDPSIPEVRSNRSIDFRMQIQNVGEADTENVKVQLFKTSNFNFSSTENEVGNLNKPDVISKLPGQTGEIYFTATAPVITGSNQRVSSEIGARVLFDYSTIVTAEIPVLTEDTYQEYVQENALPSKLVDSSLAPLKIDILTPDYVYADAIPIVLELSKAASGYLQSTDSVSGCNTEPNDKGLNRIDYIRITFDPREVVPVCPNPVNGCPDCIFVKNEGLVQTEDSNTLETTCTELYSNQKRQLSCIFVPNATMIQERGGELYPNFVITAGYGYAVEAKTSVIVKGS